MKKIWIKEVETFHHRFLSKFPSLNLYTSYCLLEDQDLPSLLSMSLEEMKTNYPYIPPRYLDSFFSLVKSTKSISFSDDSPSTVFDTIANVPVLKEKKSKSILSSQFSENYSMSD